MREAQAGWGRGDPTSTRQHLLPPPESLGESQGGGNTHLFTLQVELSSVPSTNIPLLLSLWQAQSQAPKVNEEGPSPQAPCPQAFTVQKGRETQNWVSGRGGGEGEVVVMAGFLEEASLRPELWTGVSQAEWEETYRAGLTAERQEGHSCTDCPQ